MFSFFGNKNRKQNNTNTEQRGTEKKDFTWKYEDTLVYKQSLKFNGDLNETRAYFAEKVVGTVLTLYGQQQLIPKSYESAKKLKKFAEFDKSLADMDGGLSANLIACSQFCSAMYYNFCDLQYLHNKLGFDKPVLSENEIKTLIGKAYSGRASFLHYELTEEITAIVCKTIYRLAELADGDLPYVLGMKYDKKYVVLQNICDVMECDYYNEICEAEEKGMKKS